MRIYGRKVKKKKEWYWWELIRAICPVVACIFFFLHNKRLPPFYELNALFGLLVLKAWVVLLILFGSGYDKKD